MTIHIDADALLARLGEHGEHWIKGGWGDDNAMCLHGAIQRCQPIRGDAYLIEQVANRQGWGTSWNDADATDWEKVRERVNGGIDVTDADLADTFGPQWEQIVAVVRRAAILTGDEVKQLNATWNAAWNTDREPAGVAAWAATWNAARVADRVDDRVATWNATWNAALNADREAAGNAAGVAMQLVDRVSARVVAWDAAGALVVRDLIGQHGFTQAHYDLLVGPWVAVCGKVHPDD
jgi:hypothetical protein